MKGNSHESFESTLPEKMGSERSFGFTVGGILLLIALWPLHASEHPHWWVLFPAVLLIMIAAFDPDLLVPLNKLWFKLGILLGRIVSPIVLGIIYFGFITPYAYVMRLMGKKLLLLDFDPQAKSYWIIREPAKIDAAARMRRPY
ncbi:MAG TPA: SxtJ family membrane protein [Xanthobacteraceae bacterium]|nr:SxtJ family membrane protein [Xanthobacteraceae bacterium]